MNFKTREEYLAWRQEWKATYFEAIKAVRQAKVARKDAQRALYKDGPNVEPGIDSWKEFWRASRDNETRYWDAISDLNNLVNERARSRVLAGELRAARLKAEGRVTA